MSELLSLDFMRQALIAAVLVGIAAPLVGVFLVQRRLSLIGDGMGHVALAGVAVGVLTGQAPVLTALVAAVAAAVAIELIRGRGRTSGDIALAVMFYGGIAAGVVIIAKSPEQQPGQPHGLPLRGDHHGRPERPVGLRRARRSSCWSRPGCCGPGSSRWPTTRSTPAPAACPSPGSTSPSRCSPPSPSWSRCGSSGLLLISALMIIPNATAQLLGRSFRASIRWAVVVGVVSSVGGVVDVVLRRDPSGGTIVLLAIGFFVLAATGTAALARARAHQHRRAERHDHEHGPECGHAAVAHGDHVDYVHDGHRHAAARGPLRRARHLSPRGTEGDAQP